MAGCLADLCVMSLSMQIPCISPSWHAVQMRAESPATVLHPGISGRLLSADTSKYALAHIHWLAG